MSYKTILVHADNSAHAEGRIQLAANLAFACRAHLIGTAMTGLSRFIYPDATMAVAAELISSQIDVLNQRADDALAMFDTIAQRSGVATFERRKVDDEPDTAMALQARYADLVVVSQSDPNDPASTAVSAMPEYVMLNSPRPVLVVPYASPPLDIERHALIAWNGSLEASRAITAAIPLLERVREATVVVFNPEEHYGLHGDVPGADVATWIARRGIKLNVVSQHTTLDVGNALLSMAADLNCDVLVMGGYGRPRYRELLLGGVTRTVLETMTLPVLMAH